MSVIVFCTNKQAICVRIMKYIYQTRCVWNLEPLHLFHLHTFITVSLITQIWFRQTPIYVFGFWCHGRGWIWIEVLWINNPLYSRILGKIMIFGKLIRDGARSEIWGGEQKCERVNWSANIWKELLPLLICTWFLKNQLGKIKFDELDF